MALIGARCLGDFNYYMSFGIMVCLPLAILFMALVNYYGTSRVLKHRLRTMTKEQKIVKQTEALHELFELADSDHSGYVEPIELTEILHSLGWSIKSKAATTLAHKLGAKESNLFSKCPSHLHHDDFGHLKLSEEEFVNAMLSGQIDRILYEMNIRKTPFFAFTSVAENENEQTLSRSDRLVNWTLRSVLVSNSLSGATQLLLLAHTPVSRKVFLYFHCHLIAGRELLRADYDIDCASDGYYSFMPLVLGVLLGFTLALPLIISFYLIRHRHTLYTTKTYETIGWLYDPFVKGAEFWQVHDLLMKMILTVSRFVIYCCCTFVVDNFFCCL